MIFKIVNETSFVNLLIYLSYLSERIYKKLSQQLKQFSEHPFVKNLDYERTEKIYLLHYNLSTIKTFFDDININIDDLIKNNFNYLQYLKEKYKNINNSYERIITTLLMMEYYIDMGDVKNAKKTIDTIKIICNRNEYDKKSEIIKQHEMKMFISKLNLENKGLEVFE